VYRADDLFYLDLAATRCYATGSLGARMALDDALRLAARCGAATVTGRGPYEGQLQRGDL
jgi:sugar/nucleoside kinase (ribokinase family)